MFSHFHSFALLKGNARKLKQESVGVEILCNFLGRMRAGMEGACGERCGCGCPVLIVRVVMYGVLAGVRPQLFITQAVYCSSAGHGTKKEQSHFHPPFPFPPLSSHRQ